MTRKNMIEVQVTEEDIRQGKRFSIFSCPLALALRRKFPRSYVEVTNWYIEINGKLYGVNGPIVRFIDDFDYGKPVSPKKFRIPKVKTVVLKDGGE